MPALVETERMEIWRWIALPNREGEIDSLNRAQLRGAIDATDDWLVANAASFNQALPEAVRTALTALQKALLLTYVSRRRALIRPLQEMSGEERDNVMAEMYGKCRDAEVQGLSPADMRAGVDAIDDWIVEHGQAFNQVLPQPARGVLTVAQKVLIFSRVAYWRWLIGA